MDHYFLELAFLNKGFTAGFLDRTRSHFDQALDLDPDNIDALFSRAWIRRMTQTPAFIKSFLGLGFMQSCLRAQVGCMPCKKRSGLSGPMGISSKLIICALPKGSFSSIS
jgi:hypothetical protein